MSVRIMTGNVFERLPELPDNSVHCCVTSPPYWGLRDYGVAGQLGLERTPEEYVARMVEVFREVRRVLRPDGTLWLNLGDSYANPGNKRNGAGEARNLHTDKFHGGTAHLEQRRAVGECPGLKPKDLCGIPWRVAFALQADGWWLRQDIIWAKPNPMPESVEDRCTKAHEYIFLLTKSATYWYDQEAVKDASVDAASYRPRSPRNPDKREGDKFFATKVGSHANGKVYATRNCRSVWTIPTQPYRGAHFATFPEALARRCLLAGCPDKCCPTCGRGWERILETVKSGERKLCPKDISGHIARAGGGIDTSGLHGQYLDIKSRTLGWQPGCQCYNVESCRDTADWPRIKHLYENLPIRPGMALDPFGGSGTVGAVAETLGLDCTLVELNPKYVDLARVRTAQPSLLAQPAPLLAGAKEGA